MFQDLNDILIVFYERTEIKNNQHINQHNNHNSTKRVYLNNIHNKHSKTYKKQYKEMSDDTEELEPKLEENSFINDLTLNFLISKSQLQKLNKMKHKETIPEHNYDKTRIIKLFNKLLNNDRPDDLLEDVKTCFDAFIEKSIYYLEIYDKNVHIQNERNDHIKEEEMDEDEDLNEDLNEDLEDDFNEDLEEEYFEEPYVKVTAKYSNNKVTKSKGVEDIHKLPLDWFNTTRQNYKINQIIPRKKEIIIDNKSIEKKKI